MPPLKNAVICLGHFELSCFEEDFREKLMPGSYGRSRSLRGNAIPKVQMRDLPVNAENIKLVMKK